MDKVITTIIGVVVAVGVSGLLFVGANKLFDLAPRRWTIFGSLVGGATGFLAFLLLWGNRLIDQPVVITVIATAIGAAAGYLLTTNDQRETRLGIGLGAGVALGALAAYGFQDEIRPPLDLAAIVVWTLVGAALGTGLWVLRGRTKPLIRYLLLWGSFGWGLGALLAPELGTGSFVEALIGMAVFGGGLGAFLAVRTNPDYPAREAISQKARAAIFLAPALIFVGAALVLPLLKTVFLSFWQTSPLGSTEDFIALENYGNIFTDPNVFKVSEWANIFTSKLFIIGALMLLGGFIAARVLGRRTGHTLEKAPSTISPMALGLFLIGIAIFASLRGTVFNNLWWVMTVTVVATTMGLAIAVLADRARFESLAKSLIFMPMAISFVGASIIWRFMYLARDTSKEQTGVLNSLWVALGQISNSTVGKTIAILVVGAIIAGLLYLAFRGRNAGAESMTIGALLTALPLIWILYRLVGPGLGGFVINDAGEAVPDTILFIQESPFNNMFLMVVLIWIQTGFSMIIFSAAIKAVPAELLEASRVDGATESQAFWRIVVPQIATTIGVVVTTLIVLVMKVFDIVKVMTNGNFDTQVLANEMWQRSFTELDFGLGSAVAVVLFISVLPIMYLNIRRMQEA